MLVEGLGVELDHEKADPARGAVGEGGGRNTVEIHGRSRAPFLRTSARRVTTSGGAVVSLIR